MSKTGTFDLSIVTNRYAKAFIELAEKVDLQDKFNEDLMLVKETFEANKDLKDFTEHPLIQNNDKKEIIDTIFREHISIYTLNLLKILVESNRIFILPLLSKHYKELLDKKRNIVTAQVITAIEIDEDARNMLKHKLQVLLSSEVNLEQTIDEDIIAGVIVKIGDKVIDGSIRTGIENMKKQLI